MQLLSKLFSTVDLMTCKSLIVCIARFIAALKYSQYSLRSRVSYDEVAQFAAEVAGTELNIQHYDISLGKAKFPFRLTDFYVSPDLAKSKLGWKGSQHSLKDDLKWYFESYKARGGMTKDLEFAEDKELVA